LHHFRATIQIAAHKHLGFLPKTGFQEIIMRFPFLPFIMASTFRGIQEHAEKVKECAWIFQQAIECHVNFNCDLFDALRTEVIQLESEADVIKNRIRAYLPRERLMPMNKVLLLKYIQEQDGVLDAVVGALAWISYRSRESVPAELHKDFFLLVDAVMDPFEEITKMAIEAGKYFQRFSESQRSKVKEIIRAIRQQEHEADKVEEMIIQKAFESVTDPISLFHVIRLAESIGAIANHAENAGDTMRAMLAR
jgi:predicted phosphate transport protein (TIGR00153 family)